MTDFNASVMQGSHSCNSGLTEQYLENCNMHSHQRKYLEFSNLSTRNGKKRKKKLISSVGIFRCGREKAWWGVHRHTAGGLWYPTPPGENKVQFSATSPHPGSHTWSKMSIQ